MVTGFTGTGILLVKFAFLSPEEERVHGNNGLGEVVYRVSLRKKEGGNDLKNEEHVSEKKAKAFSPSCLPSLRLRCFTL